MSRIDSGRAADDAERSPSDTTIVDTDVHLNKGMTRHDIAEYTGEPHTTRLTNPDYAPFPDSGWDRNLGKMEQKYIDDADDLHEQLVEGFHVDYPIINGTSIITRLPDSEFACACMRAVNDLLVEEYLEKKDHFYGLLTVATQRPEEAAEEIDRLGDRDDVVGIYVCTTGPRTPLGDPRYDVMYRAAADHDLQVTYHGSAGAFMFDFQKQNQGFERFLPVHTLAHPWSQMETVCSLITQGTPAKFPDLNFVFLESGVGWAPYLTFRLNSEYSKRRSEAPLLEKSPEEYIRDQFYFTSQPVGEANDPEDMSRLLETLGAESLMFASDFPHWDFDHPDAFDTHLRETFDPEDRDRVLHGNAIEVFDLPIEA